jgi:alginate O-acetyltransferase complex protein AlgI
MRERTLETAIARTPASVVSLGWAAMLFAFALLTYALVNVTWVFFRAHGFGKAWSLLGGMFGAHARAAPIVATSGLVLTASIIATLVAAHWWMRERTLETAIARTPASVVSLGWAAMLFAIVITQGSGNAFIYFQF